MELACLPTPRKKYLSSGYNHRWDVQGNYPGNSLYSESNWRVVESGTWTPRAEATTCRKRTFP